MSEILRKFMKIYQICLGKKTSMKIGEKYENQKFAKNANNMGLELFSPFPLHFWIKI